MATKCLAVIVASLLLFGIASAQEYSIRANRGLNLRAAPSRNAAIADRVFSGAILQVVGKFNRWLKIDRNGREVWLADWVDFSRVASSEPSGSPAPTGPIDNCCYVDRQCHSELEWMGGWHAFQNGQCAAPAQPQPATPAQPVSSAPANVDNCCYVDRQCRSDEEWVAGYWAFQSQECPASVQPQPTTSASPPLTVPTNGGNCCNRGWLCRYPEEKAQGYWVYQMNQCAGLPQISDVALTGPVPRIEGSDRFVQEITDTLKFMKAVAPAWYNYVIGGMDRIVEVHPTSDDGFCYARASDHDRTVTVESCWIDTNSRITGVDEHDYGDLASMLGHEACHIHTHEDGKLFANQEHEEAECRKFGTGAAVFVRSAVSSGLGPRRGTQYFYKDQALDLLRSYCSQGYRADLFCPTLQRLESMWSQVPYAIFPPDWKLF